jgi:hypothetical protein
MPQDHNVVKMLLPNIDILQSGPCLKFAPGSPPHCHPMLGLHPTSVGEDYAVNYKLIKSSGKMKNSLLLAKQGWMHTGIKAI